MPVYLWTLHLWIYTLGIEFWFLWIGFGFRSVKVHCRIKSVPTLQTAVVCGREVSRGWHISSSVLIPEDKTCTSLWGGRYCPGWGTKWQMKLKKEKTRLKGKAPFCTDPNKTVVTSSTHGNTSWEKSLAGWKLDLPSFTSVAFPNRHSMDRHGSHVSRTVE